MTAAVGVVAVMAAVTVATRLAGLLVPARWTERGRIGAAFRALPMAVLSAVVAPAVLATGWRETAAAVAAALSAALGLPLVATVVVGVASVVALRALI
jgi:uncharacterized membrane protein